MASTAIRRALKNVKGHSRLLKFTNKTTCFMNIEKRFLFNAEILGIDNYDRQRVSMQERIGDMREKFRSRMEQYMDAAGKNTIFTDDLKTMIHLAEVSDLDTAERMIKRFHEQNDDLRFSTFVFGPLVMRLLHVLKQPDRAMKFFTDETLKGFFDQMSSYVVVMDLLFESGRYDDVRELMTHVTQSEIGGYKFPIDCVTLYLASCLKQNTTESLQASLSLLRECRAVNARVSLRGVVYTTLLALQQNDPVTALEVLSVAQISGTKTPPLVYTNVKILTYSHLGRTEEAVRLLRSFLNNDRPGYMQQGGEIFQEVLAAVRKAVSAQNDVELTRTFELVERGLTSGNHVTDVTLDEYIYRPVVRRRHLQDGYRANRQMGRGGNGNRRRPGLAAGEARVSF